MKNLFKNYMLKALTILFVLISTNTYSQLNIEWSKNYGGSASDSLSVVKQTADGGYILGGRSYSNNFDVSNNYGLTDYWLVKINATGTIQWEKNYGGSNWEELYSLQQTQDGGYILGGDSGSNDDDVSNNYGNGDFWVVKTDSTGTIQWEKNYGGFSGENLNSLEQTQDGGYILGGSSSSNDNDVSNNYGWPDFWLVKINATGTIQWEKNYGGSDREELNSLQQTQDGGYILGGSSSSNDNDVSNNYGSRDFWVVKTDATGTIQWEKNYGGSDREELNSLQQTQDGGYILGGYSQSLSNDVSNNYGSRDFWVVKIDATGTIQWEKNYGGSSVDYIRSLQQTQDGGYILGGYSQSLSNDVSNNYGSRDFWVVKIDATGMIQWEKNYGGSNSEELYSLEQTQDGGYILGGYSKSLSNDVSNNYGNGDFWVVKIKSFLGEINGVVTLDTNENCINDVGEANDSSIIITANNLLTNLNYYDITNSLGLFNIPVDTVSHEVSISLPSPYYEVVACSQDTQLVNLNSTNLTETIDFFINPAVYCPYMEVDISTPLLRRCFSNNYYVSYCNNGTAIANNSYVEVELDSALVIDSSSIPWTTVVGNIYTFPIGNIDIFDCGTFSISVSVPCDSTTFLGQVLCAEAHIYPDSVCLPSSNTWNGAELEARAECVGQDSIAFTLKNIGAGNMNSDEPVIVIEDVILIMDSMGQLNAGDEMIWKFPTNGLSTHRIIAQQPNDHPYKTFTTDAVANCNLMASAGPPPVTDSAFLAYPNDEESPFEAVDCQPIIGSYDPNDKTAYPTGVGANHFITENTDLEYKIRFQNTGTDTAFTVVIRDSISNLLDLTTFSAGASSHSYTYNIYGTGVVDFTFNNILLPDSFVNEPASHGFVQYKIVQKAGNQVGDIILNNADIFFDYNQPIKTNTTFNEIGGIFLDTIIYKFPNEEEIPDGINELVHQEIKVYPNPSSNVMYFEFEENQKGLSIELFDLSGKMQQKTVGVNTNKLKIDRGNLVSGMYLFKIYSENQEIAFGKLIFK